MHRAALYLRSSKDRSDVSIDAQRRELLALAADRGLPVVQEFRDVVESAKSEHRPGFQSLLLELKSSARQWDHLILLDTSRLSRRRYVAQVFKHEASKRGVTIIYAKVPETDPISAVILEAVFEAMDEVHSLMSKEKGLAGMRENVRQGFRAGGRAPRGYRLRKVATGAVRDGEAVTKSVLEPSEEAHKVARYLRARASGAARATAAQEAGLELGGSSLIGLEWNALAYAGHTVWNQTNERTHDGYKGGQKRRPRAEWVIQENTHEALITQQEAERLLERLEASDIGRRVSEAKSGVSDYLLTGVLVAPDGRQWTGYRQAQYKLKAGSGKRGRYVDAKPVEDAVMGQLLRDLRSRQFVRGLVKKAQELAVAEDPAAELREEIVGINKQIDRATELAMQLEDPSPMLRKVDELERKRKALADEVSSLEREHSVRGALGSITEQQVSDLLAGLAGEMAENPKTKQVLRAFVHRVVLDPQTLDCQIHYKMSVSDSLNVASPRVRDGWAVLELLSRRWRIARAA